MFLLFFIKIKKCIFLNILLSYFMKEDSFFFFYFDLNSLVSGGRGNTVSLNKF